MYDNIRLGDLIGHLHPTASKSLKVGIVIDTQKNDFIVKWIWYDKLFFMDDEHEVFNDLNKQYLLTETQYDRNDLNTCLKLVSCGY